MNCETYSNTKILIWFQKISKNYFFPIFYWIQGVLSLHEFWAREKVVQAEFVLSLHELPPVVRTMYI